MHYKKIFPKLNSFGLLWLLLGVGGFLLILRNLGLYPQVFADEYVYNKFARLQPLKDAEIPGYLYLWVYRITNLSGDSFLNGVRFLNVLFFVVAVFFIYLVAKKITSTSNALLIASLALLGPINSYTVYFMPESFYYLAFWLFTYLILNLKKEDGYSSWLFLGLILALASLIKPHALFLLPAVGLYLLWVQYCVWPSKSFGRLFKEYSSFWGALFLSKFVVGYLFAGRAGLTLFGSAYTAFAVNNRASLAAYAHLLKISWPNLTGHILSLSLLFSLALVVVFVLVRLALKDRECRQDPVVSLAVYSLLILLSLVVIVAVFTALAEGPQGNRLYFRYYNFAFPLLWLSVAGYLANNLACKPRKIRFFLSISIIGAVLYALYHKLSPYGPFFIDNPELFAFKSNRQSFYVFGVISLFSLCLWIYKEKWGLKFFLYFFTPMIMASATCRMHKELQKFSLASVYDRAGIFARYYFTKEDLSKLEIAGSPGERLLHTAFYLNALSVKMNFLPPGSVYDLAKLPTDREWLLLIGEHQLVNNQAYTLNFKGFTLVKKSAFLESRAVANTR